MRVLCLMFFSLSLFSCQNASSQKSSNVETDSEYWSDGKAEICRYALKQHRYGSERAGDLVQIFVPEDFLTDKQVKNESYRSKNSTRVLKRIETRQFNTGIYQYNMFTSSFTPFNIAKWPKTIKVSSSSQEWCGTTYVQLNLNAKNYSAKMHSYFEKEADTETLIKNAVPEEDLFSKIRLSPDILPKGDFDIIPSQIVSRFLHLPLRSYKANGTLSKYPGSEFKGQDLLVYTIEIPELDRTVKIYFENDNPHIIQGWTDSYPNPFTKTKSTTQATLTHQLKKEYWNLNGISDDEWRKSLGLE